MIRIRQIKISIWEDQQEQLRRKIARELHIKSNQISSLSIVKQSLDARHKDRLQYVYEVDVTVNEEDKILKRRQSTNIFLAPSEKYEMPPRGNIPLRKRPVIVGSGPAGLFAAYQLAEQGYEPIVIERGEAMAQRIQSVEQFFQMGELKENSNIQFGEGGAGTFSDGKLNTLVKDKHGRGRRVFEIFVVHGAPREILYQNHPHIGTDLLRSVIVKMRKTIIQKGGTFRYNTCLTDLVIEQDQLVAIEVNHDEQIPCDTLILAVGHSARDTFQLLDQKKIKMVPKAFAVGVRICHPQAMINRSQYGDLKEDILPPASYKLTYTTRRGRGVYSFCMCPGGYVINASSLPGHLTINGMSNHKRDSETANSAIVVTVTPEDYGNNLFDGIRFQSDLEKAAYRLADGKIPIQLWKDLKENRVSCSFQGVQPCFQGKYEFANLNNILPSFLREALLEAMPYFDQKIKGFARPDAIIAAIESRTSSPLRICRDDEMEANVKGIYPIGEGAGYAGGITTAAMDGIKVSEIIQKKYFPCYFSK